MAHLEIPLAAHVLTGAILSLVVPLGVLIVVMVWYGLLFERGARGR